MASTVKRILLFAIVLFTLSGTVESTSCTPGSPCPPRPRIIVSPTSQRVRHTSPLRMTCVAYLGNETLQQPTSMTWYTEANQIIRNSSQVNIYSTIVVKRGLVFMESILEACIIYSDLIGQLSCGVSNVGGEDNSRWNITYEFPPNTAPRLLVTPTNQTVDCRGRVSMVCIVNAFPVPDIRWTFNDVYVDPEASNNINIVDGGMSRYGLNFSESYFDICAVEQIGNYKCTASNAHGNVISSAAFVDINLNTAPPVIPPTITRKDRTSADEAIVEFEPQSLGSFEVTYYAANDSTTPYLTERIGSLQATIERPQVTLTGLDICSRYWVVVTGLYCSRTGSTEPILIDLSSTAQYELTLPLGSKNKTCDTWITEYPEAKASDMEVQLQKPTSDCGFNIPCFERSRWECANEDQTKVTFKTQLVGHNSDTAGQIKKCIDDWITASSAKGRTFSVAGNNLTIDYYVETTVAPGASALPIWIWIVIAVGGVLLVACLVTVLFSIALRTRYKRSSSAKKEVLINSDEKQDGEGYTEVAVVDNPLYAENEGDVAAYMKENLGAEHDEDIIEDGAEPYGEDPKKTEI